MRSTFRPILMVLGLSAFALACNRGGGEPEDTPIVIEENEPIALGEPTEPTAEEVDVVDEPRVITRTVVVRERPAPTPTREQPRAEEPARPTRPSAIPSGVSIPISLLTNIDSQDNNVGDAWTGRVTRDVVVNGFVVIPGGSTVSGVITAMDEGDGDGVGSITLDARSVETVSGTRSLAASPAAVGQVYEDNSFPARETAIGAGAGAVVGAIVGGKKGAAIGAATGAAGGAAMGTARNQREVRAGAGTSFTVETQSPVDI
jgi:hypothetical protein